MKAYMNSHWQDFILVGVVIIVGVALSVAPHILWFIKSGDIVWIAHEEDLFYLSIASNAYYNHPMFLSDPVLAAGGFTIYPWLQFVPAIILAKIIGLSPIFINFLWRIWAGISISLTWYLVARAYLKNIWLALGASIILMTDTGMLLGALGYKHFGIIASIVAGKPGDFFNEWPLHMVQWRIFSPALCMPYLLLHIWLLNRALMKPTHRRILIAAAGFGLLFYIFFYYWTAAALALLIGMVLDSWHRKTYFWVGLLGFFSGLPSIFIHLLVERNTNAEWLPRMDNFLPIAHFSELLLPKIAIFFLFVSFFWVVFRRKELIYVWALGLSGILLGNHQFLTGLQIQNFHWLFCSGPAISLLFMVFILELMQSFRFWRKFLVGTGVIFLLFYISTGFWLMGLDSQEEGSMRLTTNYHKYHEQRLNNPALSLAPRAVIVGPEEFVDFAVVMENQRRLSGLAVEVSPSVDNAEWDARVALNAYLKGIERSEFLGKQLSDLSQGWGPWSRDSKKCSERIENRQKYFDEISINPAVAVKHFQVRYIALPTGCKKPEYLSIGWKLFQDGVYWKIYEFNGA